MHCIQGRVICEMQRLGALLAGRNTSFETSHSIEARSSPTGKMYMDWT